MAKAKAAKKGKGKSTKKNGVANEVLAPISLDPAGRAFAAPVPQDDVGLGPIDLGAVDHDAMSFRAAADGTADANGDGTGASDDGPAQATVTTRRQRWTGSRVLLLCGGVAVSALAVALIVSLVSLGNQRALSSSRTSALAVARTDAVQLASYDYRHLDSDFAVVAAQSTSSFRRSFTQSSDALKSTLTRFRATAAASVVSAGLVSASTSKAVALVLLDQKIANATQKAPTTDRTQVEITLVSSGGRWLIDQVTLL